MPSGVEQDLAEFLSLSRDIGRDLLKTQGAGGNTSFKSGGRMWVKASGTWLSEAVDRDIMVPVEVEPLLDALRNGDPRAEKATDFVISELNGTGLRPSIETSFHAALPQTIVAHYHCVNTIALSVLAERDQLIAERMASLPHLRWATIRYDRPGTPLALEIDAISGDRPDVLILYNHGIIVSGDSVEDVRKRIDDVTAALAMPERTTAAADVAALEALAEGFGFHPAEDIASHKTALDQDALAFALGGSLYPDHVIFLGTEIGVLGSNDNIADYAAARATAGEPMPKLLLVPGKGVLLSNELTAGGRVMARCLAEVTTRIPAGAEPIYLTERQEYDLTNWEAEKYRQALDRKASQQG
jgi:rhamnose utilization protein RhaD (predicted bifunctional aldolase and dehydrogenase)